MKCKKEIGRKKDERKLCRVLGVEIPLSRYHINYE